MGKEQKQASVSTLLGSDANIEGTIEFQDTIRLDGNVKGKIYGNEGTVVIGEKAVVEAEIVVDIAIIMGEVNGTVDAKKRIEVYPPARVVGDIQAPTVLIESGVMFDGNCTMKDRTVTSSKTSAPPKELSFSKKPEG
jgi:cytoskeletal protein CcmA (bactofilin family)